jgi:hypothetical protein
VKFSINTDHRPSDVWTAAGRPRERLAEHARAVTSQVNKFAIRLTPEVRSEASQKLSYGKQVLMAVDQLLDSDDDIDDDLAYQIFVSIRPNLIVAIDELEKQLTSSEPLQTHQPKAKTQEQVLEELEAHFAQNLADVQRHVDETGAAYARAVGPLPPARHSGTDEADIQESDEEEGDAMTVGTESAEKIESAMDQNFEEEQEIESE